MAMTIHILNGPNLNLLGTREPQVYGTQTLAEIAEDCAAAAKGLGLELVFEQTNVEGALIDLLHRAGREADGVILNAAAYTHTSVALHDAIKAVGIPVVEVHLSNPHAREPFRHRSYVSPVADGVICGFGALGYRLALEALAADLTSSQK